MKPSVTLTESEVKKDVMEFINKIGTLNSIDPELIESYLERASIKEWIIIIFTGIQQDSNVDEDNFLDHIASKCAVITQALNILLLAEVNLDKKYRAYEEAVKIILEFLKSTFESFESLNKSLNKLEDVPVVQESRNEQENTDPGPYDIYNTTDISLDLWL